MENILTLDASQNLHNSQSFLTNLKLYSLSDSCHDAYRHLISNYGDTNYMTIQTKNNIHKLSKISKVPKYSAKKWNPKFT